MLTDTLSLVKMTPSLCMAPSKVLTYAEALAWVRDGIAPFAPDRIMLEWESAVGGRLRWVVENGEITEQRAAMLWSAPSPVEDDDDESEMPS